jgi:hypothetical protein
MRKTAAVLILSLSTTILSLGSVSPVEASNTPTPSHPHLDWSRKKYGAILPDKYYDSLAQCETGGNWNHSTRSYTGGLGIHRQTFRRWSKYQSAKGLTPRQQVRVADAIAFSGYTTRDGTHIWRVGPFGWGCVRGSALLKAYICKSNHPKVVRYRKRAC